MIDRQHLNGTRIGRLIFGQMDGQTYRWTDRWIDRQTDGWTDGRTNGQTDKYTLLQRCVDASKENEAICHKLRAPSLQQQTDRPTDRQTNQPTNQLTDRARQDGTSRNR